jgi:hypothetical protein
MRSKTDTDSNASRESNSDSVTKCDTESFANPNANSYGNNPYFIAEPNPDADSNSDPQEAVTRLVGLPARRSRFGPEFTVDTIDDRVAAESAAHHCCYLNRAISWRD